MNNLCIFQFFHWYYPSDGSLWKFAAGEAAKLSEAGVTHVWLPPAYKAADGDEGVGYAVYDLFDLGEFDQKKSVRTKYGTKEEYLACIKAFQQNGISVLADIVLNHKQGADEEEKVPVIEVDCHDRNNFIGEQQEVDLYTKYEFKGRKNKYSDYVWNWQSFSGIDKKEGDKYSIFKILNEYGPGWDEVVDPEFGNYDYLMGADIELRNPHVKEELKWWGKWYCETTGIDGFRLDAVKHMSPSFVNEWLDYLKQEFKKDFFSIAEYWSADVKILLEYLERTNYSTQLMDVALHRKFHEMCQHQPERDLRQIFDDTLVQCKPAFSITFVNNHDTQPLQALECKVEEWFEAIAYAIILLRKQGIPCIFFPNYYGADYSDKGHTITMKPVKHLQAMMAARKSKAYGEQNDYFDEPNLIGWTRSGDESHPGSGLAVLISSGGSANKNMEVGKQFAGQSFVDITGNCTNAVMVDDDGSALFFVNERSVSVYVLQ